MTRHLVASLVIVAGTFVLTRADEPETKPKAKPPSTQDEALGQEGLSQQFKQVEGALLQLALRLEASKRPEDRDRAAIIRDALKQAKAADIDNKFEKLKSLLVPAPEGLLVPTPVSQRVNSVKNDLRLKSS